MSDGQKHRRRKSFTANERQSLVEQKARGGAMRILAALTLIVLPGAAAVSDVLALAMTRPQEQIVANDIAPERLAALLKPVDAFYGFWVNGSPALLASAIGPDFVDHTLPHGRPRGPTGTAQASKGFLAAVL